MKTKKALLSLCLLFLILLTALSFASCDTSFLDSALTHPNNNISSGDISSTVIDEESSIVNREENSNDIQEESSSDTINYISYTWYDADNSLLYKEVLVETSTPTNYPIPRDTEKWDYIEWREGETSTEKIAYRVPQTSYLLGMYFKLLSKI
jgi:hypothetical protein